MSPSARADLANNWQDSASEGAWCGRGRAVELGCARGKGSWAPRCPFLQAWGQPAPLQVSKLHQTPSWA